MKNPGIENGALLYNNIYEHQINQTNTCNNNNLGSSSVGMALDGFEWLYLFIIHPSLAPTNWIERFDSVYIIPVAYRV